MKNLTVLNGVLIAVALVVVAFGTSCRAGPPPSHVVTEDFADFWKSHMEPLLAPLIGSDDLITNDLFYVNNDDNGIFPKQLSERGVKVLQKVIEAVLYGPRFIMEKVVELFTSPATKDQMTKEGIWSDFVDEQIKMFKDSITHGESFSDEDWKPFGLNPYPFFGFVPERMDTIIPTSDSETAKNPNSNVVTWSGRCFKKFSAKAIIHVHPDGSSDTDVEIEASEKDNLLCMDHFLLGTVEQVAFKGFFHPGTHRFTWKISKEETSGSKLFDITTKGIRVFRFNDSPLQNLVNLYETVMLFLEPLTRRAVDNASKKRNLYFLSHYTHLPAKPARKVSNVDIDENSIQSGDFFGIVRLDGLDPMLAWAMGSTTGHTTVAVRDPKDNALYVLESTTNSAYWPANGVQRTPWKNWIQQARDASYEVVHAPLSDKYRSLFNATSALDWFHTVEGLDYGYQTMLFAWIDTQSDNYPCLPPDFQACLTYTHVEVLIGALEHISRKTSDLLFTAALNQRVGTKNLPIADVLELGHGRGYNDRMMQLPEQDSYIYAMNRFGVPSHGTAMVCCSFVCNIWKSAGIFTEIGNKINCGELTNWDDYSLDIFNKTLMGPNRPKACVDADPKGQLCQLSGKYLLELNNYSERKMASYMAESCPSKAPDYPRVEKC